MRAIFKGKVLKFERNGSDTTMTVDFEGEVDVRNNTAKPATLEATITIKNIVADQMKIGSELKITVEEEISEGAIF